MAKNILDSLESDLQATDKAKATLNEASATLAKDRAHVWRLLGIPFVQFGPLKFSKFAVVFGGGLVAFLLAAMIVGPILGLAIGGAAAGALGVAAVLRA